MALDFPSNPEVGETYETAGNLYTWTGDRWMARAYTLEYPVPIYTNMVLTTPRDPDPELAGVVAAEPEILETQEQVNDLLADAAKAIAKNAERVADAVDFSQNTIGKGYWAHQIPPNEAELYPRPGEFWTNDNETGFGQITEFKFNDTGLPGSNDPGSLEGTKIGDYLLVQCNGTNDFGYYVVTSLEVENVGNQIFRTLGVKLFRDARFKGTSTEGVRHTVSSLRPVYTIVADEQPVVSTRGLLWYRESDDHLFISNYGDGFVGDGPQWTDLTAGGDYLPLSGGTVTGPTTFDCPTMVKWDGATSNSYPFSVYGGDKWTFRVGEDGSIKAFGNITINQESGTALNIKKGGIDKVKIEHGGRIFCAYDLSLDSDSRTVTTKGWVNSQITTKGDERYLQLAEGGKITGYVQFQDDTKLQMGGTYNNNIIDGKEGFTDNSIVATLGFVNHAVANSGVGLPHAEKMYLQGFYPWRFAEGSNPNEGEWVAKTYDYNVVLDPASWKMLYFSVVDAYGQDLAGKFLNHLDMDNYRELQMWFAREDGTKICSYIGRMKCRDQNFEERFTVDMDASDKELLTSPKWDTASLEITRGEVLWIKCSAWGN